MDEIFIEESKKVEEVIRSLNMQIAILRNTMPYPEVGLYSTGADRAERENLEWQKSMNSSQYKQIEYYHSFLDNPYFARMDFRIKEDEKTDYLQIYIGKKSLEMGGAQVIFDWRSPIGQRYYIKNELLFEFQNTLYNILIRRALRIKEGQLKAYQDEYVEGDEIFAEGVADPFLVQALREKRGEFRLTDIIRTIQHKQNEIIRKPISTDLIVQGCAGSGKTMIMLHRLSYLKYNNPNLNLEKVKILTPNELFSTFIDDLSEQLELESIERMTIEKYYIVLLNQYDANKWRIAKVDNEEEILNDAFLAEVYSDQFYLECKTSYESHIGRIADTLKVGFQKEMCEKYQFKCLIGDHSTDKYKISAYKDSIKSILTENEKNQDSLVKAIKAKQAKVDKLREIERELALNEEYIELEKQAIKDISERNAQISRVGEMDMFYNYWQEQLQIDKQLDLLNNLKERISNKEVNLHTITDSVIDLGLNDVAYERLMELKELYGKTSFLNFIRRSKLRKEIEENVSILRQKLIKLVDEKIHEMQTVKESLQIKMQEISNSITILKIEDTPGISEGWIFTKRKKLNLERLAAEEKIAQIESTRRIRKKPLTDVLEDIEKANHIVADYEGRILAKDEKVIIETLLIEAERISPQTIFNMTVKAAIEEIEKDHKIESRDSITRCDLYMNLWFWYWYSGKLVKTDLLINVDEGQDISRLEYGLMSLVNGGATFNIYGDINQRIKKGWGTDSWGELAESIKADVFQLDENYRNTVEITGFCNEELGFNIIPIGIRGNHARKIKKEQAIDELKHMELNQIEKRVAIIANSKNLLVFTMVKDINGIVSDNIKKHSISLLSVEHAKGLEFDSVYVFSEGMSLNEKYIAYTRAINELSVIE